MLWAFNFRELRNFKVKNNYFIYNLKGILRSLKPYFLNTSYEKILKGWQDRDDSEYIKQRVNYYNRLNDFVKLGDEAKSISFVRFGKKQSVYRFDSWEYLRHFPQSFTANFAFGDVNYFLPNPSITKSRPIEQIDFTNIANLASGDGLQGLEFAREVLKIKESSKDSKNLDFKKYEYISNKKQDKLKLKSSNSILLNLEKVRHFTFINDPYTWEDKQDKLFYRGGIYQSHRVKFFEKYFSNKMCDLGHTGSKDIHHSWQKPKIGIKDHLPYKFLLSLEGNDVASNLKWVMSSNSLAFMPKPKFETWFMEGILEANVHYVEIRDDYLDLEEKLEYYLSHPNKAKEIINNAHSYISQFFDKEREDIISLLVLQKYFYYTRQIDKLMD